MTNIYDLANELERGIRALPEYKTLVEKKKQLQLMLKLALFSKSLPISKRISNAKMQAGTMPTAEEQAAVQELGQKVELMHF